jgi:hypothetical protein
MTAASERADAEDRRLRRGRHLDALAEHESMRRDIKSLSPGFEQQPGRAPNEPNMRLIG